MKILKQCVCLLLGLMPMLAQAALDGTFTISPVSGNAPLTATLTWNVTGGTATTRCTASGDWSSNAPLSGTQPTSPLLNDASYTLTCTTPAVPAGPPATGSIDLSWEAPTQNTDNTPLTTLAGHRIVYGQSSTALTQTVTISNASARTYRVTGLSSGTWYLAVRAYTSTGAESVNSNVASKALTISGGTTGTPAQSWTKTVSVDVNAQPQPPTLTVAALEVYKPNVGYKGQLKADLIGKFTVLGQVCVPGQDMNGFNVVKITTPTPLIKLNPGVTKWPMQVLALCKSKQG